MVMAVQGVAEIDREPLLRIEDLSVAYGSSPVLDGIDLEIREGEIVALAGENGAGKSTLVRCIAGDKVAKSGRIFLSGSRLPTSPGAVSRLGVAVVWQDLALCDNLDVAANLLLGRERSRVLLSDVRFHAAAADLLAELQIPLTATSQLVGLLSGGQRQLVAVARAMRDHPQLLILDEPTAALGVHEAAQVEDLTANLRRQGTTILLVSHDIDQMFRLADRVVVLHHGRITAVLDTATSHPDEVAALVAGQEVDSSARRQLSRLHGLVDRLASAEPSSSLSLIISALGAALSTQQLCIHVLDGDRLRAAGFVGFPKVLAEAWQELPVGRDGGPVGKAAAIGEPVCHGDVRTSADWAPYAGLARLGRVGSSWSIPVTGSDGLTGVVTVLRPDIGLPSRDQLDLVTLYAGYAANAVERDRLLSELTARNRVLETIREVLETLAGPVLLVDGLPVALQALRIGLQADGVGLFTGKPDDPPICRGLVDSGGDGGTPSSDLLEIARRTLSEHPADGHAHPLAGWEHGWLVTVAFAAPTDGAVLLARWDEGDVPSDSTALLEDAAHSLRLALEREESERAHQEATALRRSQELQQQFLSRLSHELRTPLTAIRGYASSLMQPDVTWDGASQARFLTRIGAESDRLGRLVDDLLDFSAIEANILRIHPDWCDLSLVLDAAIACLPAADGAKITVSGLDNAIVWADHDRLEQVFVNLLSNAVRHNPEGTQVAVDVSTEDAAGEAAEAGASGVLAGEAGEDRPPRVAISVTDDGSGIPADVMSSLFQPHPARRTPSAGPGLGLSIAYGIIEAHGGEIVVEHVAPGTRFVVSLPVEVVGSSPETLHDV